MYMYEKYLKHFVIFETFEKRKAKWTSFFFSKFLILNF